MERFCIGELGLMPSAFWELDLVEIEWMADGFFKQQEMQWMHTREIIAACLRPHSKKDIKGKDIMPLSIDNEQPEEQEERLTKEDVEALKKRIKWHEK